MVNIKSKGLTEQVLRRLGKISGSFTVEELNTITKLDINNVSIDNKFQPVYFEDLLYFTNLKELSISNIMLGDKDISVITSLVNLEKLIFYNCNLSTFVNVSKLTNLKDLSFVRCSIRDNNFIKNIKLLENLTVINTKFDFNVLNNSNIKYLDVSYSDINNFNFNLPKLEILNVSDTKIRNYEFLMNLPLLKKVYISRYYLDVNKKLISTLKEKNIFVGDEFSNLGGDD